jgi:hypothetical protein
MLTMRRYVEPPRVRVLDFSTGSTQVRAPSDTQGSPPLRRHRSSVGNRLAAAILCILPLQDRFGLPKASIVISTDGGWVQQHKGLLSGYGGFNSAYGLATRFAHRTCQQGRTEL